MDETKKHHNPAGAVALCGRPHSLNTTMRFCGLVLVLVHTVISEDKAEVDIRVSGACSPGTNLYDGP
ncbi:hypothetical protein Y032_0002g871 [Ancylostoma ceylanicum]|uniref:Uncharacterized protein n=1 Tax=Ancylostoma ceylanicum TaxID=53326 RepID=A0A016W1T0_9BILA|nr:hypothetical protein Y032_0002g871 [Ancylostoma ceylanicum]